jgi:hypothetical protein
MPFYSHRRCYQPTVMGISYVNSYCFFAICYALLFSSAVGIGSPLWAFHLFSYF